jgi:amidase
MNELLRASALEQARLIREGKLSSEELVRLYLERIERLNPNLQAFTDVFRRRAIGAARAKDFLRKRRRADPAREPFEGVPVGIKDLNIVRGAPTRWGTKALPHLVLPFDDATVAQIRRGGFVILGKLATSELGAMPVTEPDLHPPTRNPWNVAHASGGSSGGSGTAVASGMLPIAQGSDGAGSIRIPSAFCHLFGFKPSRGRVRHPFWANDRKILYSMGPMARTVDDAAAMLDLMAGILDGKPHWAPPPSTTFAQLAKEKPKRMRIRFSTRSPLGPTDPEIAAVVLRVARVLEEMGHDVAEGAPSDGSLEEFLPLWQKLISTVPVPSWRWSRTQPVTRWLGEPGRNLSRSEVMMHQAALDARLQKEREGSDMWLTPTVPLPAPKVGAFSSMAPADAFAAAAQLGALTAPYNVLGWPAASLPLGLTSAGLPIGVQLGGSAFADADVLAVSRQLEEAMPWRDRRPPGFDA